MMIVRFLFHSVPVFCCVVFCLSVSLSVCLSVNARVVLKKLSRLSDTKIDTDKLFDFDIQGQVH